MYEDMQTTQLACKHMHDRQSLYSKCLLDSFVPKNEVSEKPCREKWQPSPLSSKCLLFGHSCKDESSMNLSLFLGSSLSVSSEEGGKV